MFEQELGVSKDVVEIIEKELLNDIKLNYRKIQEAFEDMFRSVEKATKDVLTKVDMVYEDIEDSV